MNHTACCPGPPRNLHNAQARAPIPDIGNAQALLIRMLDALFAWQDRGKERRRLGTLDERLLHDIGLDRATADAEAFKPFWRD